MVDCITKCGNKIIREIILPPRWQHILFMLDANSRVFFFIACLAYFS